MAELPATWASVELGVLIQRIEAGLNITCEERPPVSGERGLVKISAVTWGKFDERASKTFLPGAVVDERNRIYPGDLLISRANTIELVGAAVIVDRVERALYLSDKVLRLVVSESSKRWINYALKSPALRKDIQDASSGNQLSMRNLSQANLREIGVPIPSPEERAEIVRWVRSLLDCAGELERRCQAERSIVEKLTPSLLAKAFRGELVPQYPNDEPAAALLARLKTAPVKAAAEPSRRHPKTTGKRPTMKNSDKDSIKAAILKLKTDRFSFDELRSQVSGDYDSLQAALFDLLEEPSPVVRQVFDKKAKAMHLVRVRP